MTLEARIRELAKLAGFVDCGITTTEPFDEFRVAIQERMERFPEAAHLYAPVAKRMIDSSLSAPWANSIVVCIRRYGKYHLPDGIAGHIGRCYLPYPCWDNAEMMPTSLSDMGLRVAPANELIPVRWAASRAGVASLGRNNFAYSEHGSWIDIRAWFVDARLQPDQPILERQCPKDCRSCIEACPTGALSEPFVMRWDRCVAWLTYYAPEPISSDLWNRMGPWIYGCDRCQEVCPMNRGKWETTEEAPELEQIAPFLRPQALAQMDQKTYRDIIYPCFERIPLSNLERWKRSARRALAYIPPVEKHQTAVSSRRG
ncbi:epoxyqueuosine reductase [Candidatus Poribacteria bacterium]